MLQSGSVNHQLHNVILPSGKMHCKEKMTDKHKHLHFLIELFIKRTYFYFLLKLHCVIFTLI